MCRGAATAADADAAGMFVVHERFQVVLLAIRALITCIDITPRAATSLVDSGAVKPMCKRLLKIQDMDVAEACLKCLHLLSKVCQRSGRVYLLLGVFAGSAEC